MALTAVDPGFRVDHLAVADVSLAGTPYAPPRRELSDVRAHQRAPRRAARRDLGQRDQPPAARRGRLDARLHHRGPSRPEPGRRWSAVYRVVDPDFFATAGSPLLERPRLRRRRPCRHAARWRSSIRRWPIGAGRARAPSGSGSTCLDPATCRRRSPSIGVVADARQGDLDQRAGRRGLRRAGAAGDRVRPGQHDVRAAHVV